MLQTYALAFPEQVVLLLGLLLMACSVSQSSQQIGRSVILYRCTCLAALGSSFLSKEVSLLTPLFSIKPAILPFCRVAYFIALGSSFLIINDRYHHKQEVLMLFLSSLIGFNTVVSADHFVTLYLGIELLSFPLYAIVGLSLSPDRAEAGIKYFLQGSIASAFFLFGASWLYLFTGSLDLHILFNQQLSFSVQTLSMILIIGLFFFKLGLVPFHFWVADVYDQAQFSLLLFLSFIPKVAILCVLAQCNELIFSMPWLSVIIIIVITTNTYGNLGALGQLRIQRFLGYTSLGQFSFAVAGLITAPDQGMLLSLFFVSIYVGALALILFVLQYYMKNNESFDLKDFNHFADHSPRAAFLLLIGFLSLAGIPPMPGFFAKLIILLQLIDAGFFLFPLCLMLLSIVSCAYYITLIARIYNYSEKKTLTFNDHHC
jgi:NADH-quinone oxidoreductase subunit N